MTASAILLSSCERDNPADSNLGDSPPPPPTDVRVFGAYDGEIGIEWIEPAGYGNLRSVIYRSDGDTLDFRRVSVVSEDYFIDDSLDYSTGYYYYVTSLDEINRESGRSNMVTGTPYNQYAPMRPRNLLVNARNWNDSLSVYLNWIPSSSSDVAYYEIHRSGSSDFQTDSSTLHGTATGNSFIDLDDVDLLAPYYYSAVAVDKGGLKSGQSLNAGDQCLDSPGLIYPPDQSRVNYFYEFRFRTCARPANYKLIIQSNEFFGKVHEINFYSGETGEVISVPLNYYLEYYKEYYWRVFSYTGSATDPNSFSRMNKFTILPDE